MRRRDRATTGTLDYGEREGSAIDHDAFARDTALSLVDDVLRTVPAREVFTRTEALEILHRVETSLRAVPTAPAVLAIVDRVERDTQDQVMVARADLANALLDIRLAVLR
jgi:hypothetical protein